MSILTWNLKVGETVEVETPDSDLQKIVKILDGPFVLSDGLLWLRFGNRKWAFFSDIKQVWYISLIEWRMNEHYYMEFKRRRQS